MMNNVPFSDNELREAAKRVQEALLDTLPPPSECQHEFSPEFEAKMKKLCAKARWRRSLKRAVKRVAMVFITVLVGVGTWLAVDTEARAAFFGWVKERYENYVVYRFPEESVTGDSMVPTNGKYQLAEVPEGYSLFDEGESGNMNSTVYSNEDGYILAFNYAHSTEATDWFMLIDGTTHHKTKVNGYPADFFLSHDPDVSSSVAWIGENDTLFRVKGFFTEDELIEIAESVEFVEEEVTEPAEYSLGWVPTGLTERYRVNDGNSIREVYADEQGRLLKFFCIFDDPSSYALLSYMEEPIIETVDVNGYAAEVVLSSSGEEGNTISWTTERNELFYISGFYPLEDLVKMAESVELVCGDDK